jgi:hypothetical protein
MLCKDLERTVCETVEPRPTYFCNGGDQNNNSIPEADICNKLGIELRKKKNKLKLL